MNTKTKFVSNLEVETPEGFKPFAGIGKICKKVQLLKFILDDKSFIEVSFDHIFVINGIEEEAKYLIKGDVLETKSGLKEIVNIELNKKLEEVYTLLQVDSSNNSYYTNDIVSKNCKFLGGSSTLIDSDVLERIQFKDPIAMKWNGLLQIFQQPNQGSKYILGVDTAKGTGKDYSVIQILRINNQYNVEQVAIYRSNLIRPHDFSQIVVSIAKLYGNAGVMVENNDIGQTVCDSIWYEYEYEELINIDTKGLGVRSTRRTKPKANALLKEYIEKDWIKLNDERTIYELSRYEEIRPNVFAAGKHDHDDCISSLLWALYFLICDEYEDRDVEVKKIEDEFDAENEDDWEFPTMFFDDEIDE